MKALVVYDSVLRLHCTPRPAELRELLDQFGYPPEQRAARTEAIVRE